MAQVIIGAAQRDKRYPRVVSSVLFLPCCFFRVVSYLANLHPAVSFPALSASRFASTGHFHLF
jgi:hypothetical protein